MFEITARITRASLLFTFASLQCVNVAAFMVHGNHRMCSFVGDHRHRQQHHQQQPQSWDWGLRNSAENEQEGTYDETLKKLEQNLKTSSADVTHDEESTIRFLGRGKDAIVRPGVVLVAPNEEYDHFLRRSAVFIYAMGLDEYDVYVIRGMILDHPTPFTIQEMIEDNDGNVPNAKMAASTNLREEPVNSLMQNLLFRGGRLGNDAAIAMFHNNHDLAKAAGSEMIGTTGIYQGGFSSLLETDQRSLEQLSLDATQFKFFFNYMEFTEQELENMISDVDEDGDAWVSLEAPPELVLDSDYDRGQAWKRLRNFVRQANL